MEGIFVPEVSLTLLVLKTRQVEQIRRFYQALGVELAQEQHGKGPAHFAGRAGNVVIEVYPLADDGSRPGYVNPLAFAVENVAQVIKGLEGVCPTLVSPPKETAWGLHAVVKDPDGRTLEPTQR
jgi:hypothetical protein